MSASSPPDQNCVMNFHTSGGFQLVDCPGSLGDGSWRLLPWNAQKRVGWPSEQPANWTQVCPPLGGAGTVYIVQPLLATNRFRIVMPDENGFVGSSVACDP